MYAKYVNIRLYLKGNLLTGIMIMMMSLLVKLTYFNRVFEKVLIEVSDKYIEKYVIKLLKH